MVICEVLLVITSLLLILSILLHKGKGGGISDMFGGGISTAMRSSGVAERNLNRITIGVALVWFIVIVALGLMVKFDSTNTVTESDLPVVEQTVAPEETPAK